jgi:hypothetical protein
MLRTLLAEGDIGDASPQALDGIQAGALFAVANVVAAPMDAVCTGRCRQAQGRGTTARRAVAFKAPVLDSHRDEIPPPLSCVPALLLSAALLVAMLLTSSTTAFTVLRSPCSRPAVVNTGGQLAGALARLIMGWLTDHSGFAAAFGFLALATVAAACSSLTTRPRSSGEREPSSQPKASRTS